MKKTDKNKDIFNRELIKEVIKEALVRLFVLIPLLVIAIIISFCFDLGKNLTEIISYFINF